MGPIWSARASTRRRLRPLRGARRASDRGGARLIWSPRPAKENRGKWRGPHRRAKRGRWPRPRRMRSRGSTPSWRPGASNMNRRLRGGADRTARQGRWRAVGHDHRTAHLNGNRMNPPGKRTAGYLSESRAVGHRRAAGSPGRCPQVFRGHRIMRTRILAVEAGALRSRRDPRQTFRASAFPGHAGAVVGLAAAVPMC